MRLKEPALSNEQLKRQLEAAPSHSHVCFCQLGSRAKFVATKCCRECAGCRQRIKQDYVDSHAKTCVAYKQVRSGEALDFSWVKEMLSGTKGEDYGG